MPRTAIHFLKLRNVAKIFGVLVLVTVGISAAPTLAQKQSQSQAANPNPPKPSQSQPTQELPASPPAKPEDVSSMDAILAATYDVISGPAGQKRDWDRFRSLFLPGARLIAAGPKKTGEIGARTLTPDEYAKFGEPYFAKNGFTESELARHTDRYGNIAQIFSTYASRHDAKDAAPFARGINSFQLLFDGTRWWIVTIYWEEETPANPLPKEFLPAAN
jgi:hypothetical protein